MDIQTLESKILQKDIAGLARAVTLNESTKKEDNAIIDLILQKHKTKLNDSIVISISGIPGVGKSTFIETLGVYLHREGKSLAVFSIDPSSEISHGSILGDKTRMTELSALDNVFIRPSPSSNRLGGLGINTHKNIELAKVAGFDIILVETVGVGQSETTVKNLCDLFLLLLMPASGDELQGIKKGIMEVADVYVVHKADGDLENVAKISKKEIESALHMTKSTIEEPTVFSFSSLTKIGLDNIWISIQKIIEKKKENQSFLKNRVSQRQYWLKENFEEFILGMYLKKHQSDFLTLHEKINQGEYIGLREIEAILIQ